VIELRWRAVPFLIPLGVVALLPALVIWMAAFIGSLGIGFSLDALPKPVASPTLLIRLMWLGIFWAATLGGPLAAVVLGAFGAIDAELRIEHWEISARVRLPAPRWRLHQLLAVVLLAFGALLFVAMAGHLAADCVFGGDCLMPLQ
jgi:hypothetical protein